MTTRRDLLLEVNDLTDSSGNYTSPWVETCEVFDIRIIANKANSNAGILYVEEANLNDGSLAGSVIYSHSFAASSGQVRAQIGLSSRFFRVLFSNFNASTTVQAAVRAISGSESHGLV